MTSLYNHAFEIFQAAVFSVQADGLLDRSQHLAGLAEADTNGIHVVGAGKASLAMASALERRLGNLIADGIVVAPHGYVEGPREFALPSKIRIAEGGHPIPDAAGREAAAAALELAQCCGSDHLLIVLISGGASALWPLYVEGISIDDAATLNRLLLESGADIIEINTVRKHVSALGGGRLAEAARPASVLALVVSDVVGNDPSFIGSGTCSPDWTTYEDARGILQRYRCWDRIPPTVRSVIERGLKGELLETPDSSSSVFELVDLEVVGTNKIAVASAERHARDLGYRTRVMSTTLTGEARDVGCEIARSVRSAEPGSCLVWGGETTVTVTGTGRGGRNQELALAAALELEETQESVLVLSAGTDGYDGPTDAAGAWADGTTATRARELGLNPDLLLENNDSYAFFDAIGQHVMTGPTHTNVMDIVIGVRRDS